MSKCIHYGPAKRQKEERKYLDLGTDEPQGYERQGCDKCPGWDRECDRFLDNEGLSKLVSERND